MKITFTKSYRPGRYKVHINGRPAGVVTKESSTAQTWWVYQCHGTHEGQPKLTGKERTRHWAVRHAILDPLCLASDITEYFAL